MNKPILITGCQRSGTTLLNLILDSHPLICGVDEMEFDQNIKYLESPAYHPCVSIKLPKFAYAFNSHKTIPNLKVLWCVRNPKDVVTSMINLKMEVINGHYICWANHPNGAMHEIANCLTSINYQQSSYAIQEFNRISRVPYHKRDRKDAILMGAFCWQLKNELFDFYIKNNIQCMVVDYEKLIRDPKSLMGKILSYLELPWHDNVLRHHELHNKMYVGNTLGNRPIDPTNSGKWRYELSKKEMILVDMLCSKNANKFGYRHSVPYRMVQFLIHSMMDI